MNYVEIYKAVLDFHRKYSKVEDTDEYWKTVVEESGQIAKRYDNHKFVRAMLSAVVDELERKAKEMRGNADTAV